MTEILIVFFGITMLYVSMTSRLEAYIRILALQGLILFLMVLLDHSEMTVFNLVFLGAETLIFKAIIIPVFLMYIVRRNNVHREIQPYFPNFYSVLITTIIFAFGFITAFWASSYASNVRPLYFGVSISTIITGLFIIISRKKIITHVMGYIMIENGIFMLAMSVVNEMPMIVNLGVLLDLFAAIYLLGVFVARINSTFDELHIDSLSNLRD